MSSVVRRQRALPRRVTHSEALPVELVAVELVGSGPGVVEILVVDNRVTPERTIGSVVEDFSLVYCPVGLAKI